MAQRAKAQIDLSLLYTPHEGQAKIHDSPAKVKVLMVGRRWGKSRLALWELIRTFVNCLSVPASSSLVPPFHAWIVAPSYPQARQAWNELVSFLPSALVSVGGIHLEEMLIYLRGTPERPWGLIEVKSAHEPETLQTTGLDFLWVTEAQDVSDRAFEHLLPALRSPERMGRAAFEGIPPLWADHWFYKLYITSQAGRPGYLAFTATTFDNPLLTQEQLAEVMADQDLLPARVWRRMYLADFSEEAGYFSNISACTSGELALAPRLGSRYVAGLDLGRKIDPSVLHIMDGGARRLVFAKAWDAGQSWEVQRQGVLHYTQLWAVDRLVVDASSMGGDIFCEELLQLNLPVEPYTISHASRQKLLDFLAVALERQTISLPALPELLRQLRFFQHRRLPSGGYRAEAPPGEHDDHVFALALALQACDPPEGPAGGIKRIGVRYLPADDGAAQTWATRLIEKRKENRMMERARKAGLEV